MRPKLPMWECEMEVYYRRDATLLLVLSLQIRMMYNDPKLLN